VCNELEFKEAWERGGVLGAGGKKSLSAIAAMLKTSLFFRWVKLTTENGTLIDVSASRSI
jgi:hypothetical protein